MVEEHIGSQASKPLELYESLAGTIFNGSRIAVVDAKRGLLTLDRSNRRYV